VICHVYKRGRLYWGKLRLGSDGPVSRFPLGTADKRVAQAKLCHFAEEREKEANGTLPPQSVRETALRPLAELQAAFLADLQATGRSPNTLKRYGSDLRTLTAACGWRFLPDVRAGSFIAWRAQCGLSGKSCNDKLAAMNGLLRWLERQGMVRENPLAHLPNSPLRRVPCRRALTPEEAGRLLATAPHHRAVVYLVAMKTGLRRSELNQLRWEDVRLDDRCPETRGNPDPATARQDGACAAFCSQASVTAATAPERRPDTPAGAGSTPFFASGPNVRVRAAITKNRKDACLPLAADVAAALRSVRAPDAAAFAYVFNGRVPKITTFRRDLARAGIVYQDAAGRRADFHSLRVAFGTWLAVSGAHPRVAMELMRHSDLKLTMKIYTDAAQLPLAAGVAALPSFGVGNSISKLAAISPLKVASC
jgi:integrase